MAGSTYPICSRCFANFPMCLWSRSPTPSADPCCRSIGWVPCITALPRDLFHAELQPRGGYLAFLGRISAEKRPDLAIEIAIQAGLPLKIFAKVDEADE